MKKSILKAKIHHKGKEILKKGVYSIIECDACGFRHLNPIPSEREINEYYKEKYFQNKTKPTLSPDRERNDQEWANLSFNDTLRVMNEYTTNRKKNILDIGCGNGFFLNFMKQNGWDTFGIEPSLEAFEHSRSLGLNVFNLSFDKFINDKWNGYFDAICLRFVLEHLIDPIEMLKSCKKLLNNHGVLFIESPNDFNVLQEQIFQSGKSPWWVEVPDHINYFDFKSMERLLGLLGFEVVLRTASFPMESFILMGDCYIGDDEIGRICHQKRMAFDLSLPDDLRSRIYASLAKIGIGRSCLIYSKKKEYGN